MRALLLSLVTTLVLLSASAAQAAPAIPPAAEPEVVGGEPADPGEDPWMAALVIDARYEPNPFAGLICGASFISPDTVVTAAHCVEGFPVHAMDIVTGSTNLVPTETERIDVRNVRVHPDRDWRTGMYDVAAIQLVHAPTVAVTPIDLVAPADAGLWEPGDMARFTGWGVDELGQPISRLQEAESPIVADTDCRARYTGTYFHGRTMVCAGDTSPGADLVSPCYGDSGGPLTVLDGGRPVLIGLVLGGFRCGDPNYPAIFTQVGALTAFLEPYLDPDSTPDAVRNLNASRRGPRGRAVVATWLAPLFDGGSPINHYVVTMQPGNRWIVVGPGVRHLRFPRVPVGDEVEVTVSARNRLGRGLPSSVTVAPLALP